jgi:CheY-like chemotaxis protein
MMPIMSGWQFREAQLADSAISSIPVIVMSAVDSRGISADGLVHKPFSCDDLMQMISRVVQ